MARKLIQRPISIALIALAASAGWQATRANSTDAPPAPKAVDEAEAEGIIFERQQLMLKIEEEAKTLGEVVAGTAAPDKMAPAARAIADLAKESAVAFEPRVPGGRAKPEIWTNGSDYSERMKSFAEKSEQMAREAEANNMSGVMSLMSDALPCKQCHDVYRAPKKSKG